MSAVPAPTKALAITCIAPYVPHPAIAHAGGQFLHAHLNALGSVSRVQLVAPGTARNLAAARAVGAGLSVHCTPLGSPTRQRLERFAGYPLDVLAGVTPGAGMLDAVRRDGAVWDAVAISDVVEVQWTQWLPLVDDIRRRAPRATIVAVEHDVLTESLRRRASSAASWRIRQTSRLRLRRAPALERDLLNRCDAVLVFSERDAAALRDLGVHTRTVVVPPQIDWPREPVGPSGDPVVLFVGAMWRPENAEAATRFVEACWPEVLRAVPGARLRIVGDRPPAHLRRRASPSVAVTGFVSDLDTEYRGARVVIAPGSTSAGVNFKVVQAMAHALPVVAALGSADGIVEVVGGEAFAAVTGDDLAMAHAVVAMLVDGDAARRIGGAARRRLHAAWGDHRRESIADLYASLAAARSEQR